MALVKCKECSAAVSSKAKSCPSCGAPIKRGIAPGKGLLIVGGISVVLYYIANFEPGAAGLDKVDAKYQQNYKLIARAKSEVSRRLRDPDSAKFGWSWSDKVNDGDEFVCGSFNSKNGFGGYAGSRNFIYSAGNVPYIDDGGVDFSAAWRSLCGGEK